MRQPVYDRERVRARQHLGERLRFHVVADLATRLPLLEELHEQAVGEHLPLEDRALTAVEQPRTGRDDRHEPPVLPL